MRKLRIIKRNILNIKVPPVEILFFIIIEYMNVNRFFQKNHIQIHAQRIGSPIKSVNHSTIT